MLKQPTKSSTDWLVGGGEIGKLIRTTDWSTTPLGPREHWQPTTRATVQLVVDSLFPMALLWGRELVLIYNDAYRIIAAAEHPRALGRSTREIWPEGGPIDESIVAGVLDRGETVYLEDSLFPIDRGGRREDAYFTLCYSPVRGDDGAVAGSLLTLVETSRRARQEAALRAERNHMAAAAARERELLAGVIEHVPAMITIYDPTLASFHLNAETRRVLGWTDEDANTGDLMALCYPDPSYREEVRRFMEAAGPGWRELEVTAKDGSVVPSSWANVRLSDSTRIGIGLDLRERKRAERELRDSEQQLLALYDHNPAMVVLSELEDGRIIRVNEGFTQMLGFSAGEAQGRTPLELGIFPAAEDRQRLVEAVRANGSVRDREIAVRARSGALLIGLLSSTVIEIDGQQRLVTVVHDITDRERAERALRASEARLQKALAAPTVGVLFFGLAGTMHGANTTFERMSGYSSEELRGLQHWNTLTAPEFWSTTAQTAETLATTGEAAPYEKEMVRKDGSRWWGLFAPMRLSGSGRDTECIEFILDITARKRAEEALRVANDRLVEADRRKNEFLAVLSHELRNPLAPIRNSVYILEHAVPGGEQASRARQVIDRQAQHMNRLVEDLLDITRISRGKITLHRERVDLSEVARGTAEDHRELFARNGIELEIDPGEEPIWVDGDRTRLAQVIGNLLSNAAKFTPRGGRAILRVDASPDGNAVLRVRDDGAGMSRETLQQLFEPFVQAQQTLERTRGGLGLGLALVKGLVEMHGGEVTASSEGLGKGSELTVTMPLQAPARPRLAVAAPRLTTRARRVLVVEDNADAAESLRDALELGDHEVEIASSGPEGVEAARRYVPDVVLCDIGLPELDGYGVARAIRSDPDPAVRSAYLVALSGYALREDVERSIAAGFDRHVAKPPSIEALERLLHEAQPEGRHGHDAR